MATSPAAPLLLPQTPKLIGFSLTWGDPAAPLVDRRFRIDASPSEGKGVTVSGGNLMVGSRTVPHSAPLRVALPASAARTAWTDLSRVIDRSAVRYLPQNTATFPVGDLRGKAEFRLRFDRPDNTHAVNHTLLFDLQSAPLAVRDVLDSARLIAARSLTTA